MNFSIDAEKLSYIIQGCVVTLEYTIISVLLGLLLGAGLSLARISKIKLLNYISKIYISLFRGTPLLVQLSVVYFVIPGAFDYQISVFQAGIIAFSLNSAAYISEHIRGGIQAVSKGQFEAAQALGIPYALMMKDIVLPQALRNILPSLVNEIINLLKETAIISVIGGMDIMRRAQIISAETYDYLTPMMIAAICYYILVMIFTIFANYLERRLRVE
ncbi:MAG: amino acid ABC transporter permease [Rickettsiales bacterium]|nr:amino acid ABC transporter permease [Rickettsiales bacterium]